MKFLCNFFKMLKKDETDLGNELKIYSPLYGKTLKISEVPDSTFAQKLLGDGIAVKPFANGIVNAPISGKLIQFFETLHAFVIESKDGIQVLTHFGINSVNLKGEGFEAIAKEGDVVNAGDPIVKYDYEYIKNNCNSIVTPIVILDSDEYKKIKILVKPNEVVNSKTAIISVKK